ncbi:Rps23 Pro-64 3,4-dihydroxylase Tpa1-like proline 4-hydroxylase [Neorhizobium galegae]|uniref:prolyl hydroxylase family protein n=1 Tax=Neorhizobium galegae TaxID=399 RepID=UPI001AE221FC|nr:2OG-Fe(II) oxygenase [Neorhizobium galegae]MBP2559201.1 Rps23 Pro-64 3,4-dihydroxylase Tpa1-like proline 4-hydroxylase [Neorhizobium galegae]
MQLNAFEKLAPYIFYAPSFLSSAHKSSILTEIDGWSDWLPAHAGKYKDDKLVSSTEVKELRDVLVNRSSLSADNESCLGIDRALQEARSLYGLSNVIASRYVASKYTPGCHIKPHTDTDFYNTSRIFTGVYYLNEEYEGGEIYFPKFGVSLRPKAGSLLLFFSEFLHGVQPISAGERYSVVWFGQTAQPTT